MAENEGQMLEQTADKNQIIAVSRVKASTYQGQIQLSTTNLSTLQFNPICKEVDKLQKWFKSGSNIEENFQQLAFKKQNQRGEGSEASRLVDRPLQSLLIKIIYKTMQNLLYYFKATIENKQPPWYDGCKVCNKKVTVTEDGAQYTWCKNENADSNPRYHIRLKVIDSYEKATVILFEEAATSLIGCTITEYIDSMPEVPM
uniref:Putative replication protein A DNA-binding subunit D-like isoform X2 n=1 Tax=Davidia involucrata TaxID=16924 RepID=A0A5B7BNA3_DAVIN